MLGVRLGCTVHLLQGIQACLITWPPEARVREGVGRPFNPVDCRVVEGGMVTLSGC